MGSYNCYAGCQDCDPSTGCCYDSVDQGLSTTPDCSGGTTGTVAASGSATSSGGAATSTGLLSIFSGLSGLAGSISSAVSGPTTQASLSSVATTAQPYPVTVNGKIVGYSSVPTAASTSTAGVSTTDLFLFGALALAVWWLASKR